MTGCSLAMRTVSPMAAREHPGGVPRDGTRVGTFTRW